MITLKGFYKNILKADKMDRIKNTYAMHSLYSNSKKLHASDLEELTSMQVLKKFLARLHKTYKLKGPDFSSILDISYLLNFSM